MKKLKKNIKNFIRRFWFLEIFAFLFFKPRLFLFEYFYKFIDFLKFKKSFQSLVSFFKISDTDKDLNKENILFVAGQNMNIQWLQLWAVLGYIYSKRGHSISAITSRKNIIQNKFLRLCSMNIIYIEDLKIESYSLPSDLLIQISSLTNFEQIKNYEYHGMPIGQMALSTYSRLNLTGILDISSSPVLKEVKFWVSYLLKTVFIFQKILCTKKFSMLIFTEVFMEEYGAIYYASLKMKLNIIRMAGTVRDNAIVVQHLTEESDRTHFSSFSKSTWEYILKQPMTEIVLSQLNKNFEDRYGKTWAMSSRNQPNTKILSVDEGRALAGIPNGKKVAIIYSHILYDTLFFNGEDIYQNYADWLINTVKAACKNDKLYWLIKIHPSNLWRAEMNYLPEKGVYEEVRIIEKEIGALPSHVNFIYPDTPISPYTWLQIADIGITTRGTSGIELAALGKVVLTAGTGRYENIGFTINSNSPIEYETHLNNLQDVENSKQSIELGKRFAFSTFCLKPFTLDFFKPLPRTGMDKIVSTDDLVYKLVDFNYIPDSINNFIRWSFEKDNIDYINSWPS